MASVNVRWCNGCKDDPGLFGLGWLKFGGGTVSLRSFRVSGQVSIEWDDIFLCRSPAALGFEKPNWMIDVPQVESLQLI